MGKINGCLKCLFIFFNVLYAIVGCVLIYGAVKVSSFSQQMAAVGSPSLGWMWVFAIGVLCISCLGIYAGCSEKSLILKIFAGFMAVGMIIMLIVGIVVVVNRNKIKEVFDSATSEMIKPYMEHADIRNALEAIQTSGQCCGVVDASDWGGEIPQTCACDPMNQENLFHSAGCKARPQGTTGPDQIHGQSCLDLIYELINMVFKILMAFFFGLAVTALLGLLVSLLMIYQVRRHDSVGGSSIAMKGY